MLALISLLTIIVLSIAVVRIGAIALELTGLSSDVAAFQSQSAFSGTGFTTTEAESIVSHPVRRRIVRQLILFGGAGITTTIATLILTFVGQSQQAMMSRASYLLVGLLIIFFVTRSKFIYNLTKKIIVKALSQMSALQIFDYSEILGISSGYSISKIKVNSDSWMVDQALKDLKLHEEGTLILAINRKIKHKETFLGSPSGDTVIQTGDVLTAYGRCASGECLATRTKEDGDKRHQKHVNALEELVEKSEYEEGFAEV